MPVQMELKRIIISEVHEQQIIVLREVDGERSFPIVIGIFEATSIDRRVKNIVPPRPLTHDLIVSVVDQLGGDLQDIVISDLQDHTYFAKLRSPQGGGVDRGRLPAKRCHRGGGDSEGANLGGRGCAGRNGGG